MSKQVLTDISPNRIATPERSGATANSRACLLEIITILALSAAYLFPFTRLLHRIGDEGTIVYGAQRVIEGAVPYRDFVEVMGPGSFYWLALFFKILGDSWQVTQFCLLVTAAGACFLVYWIARQYVSRRAAVIAWLFFVILSLPLWPASNHHLYSNLFALASLAAFLEWQKKNRAIYLATAGVLAGITSCFIQQKGLYLLIALMIVIAMHKAKLYGRACVLKRILVLSGSYVIVGGVVTLLFYRAGALEDLINCTFTWPLTAYHTVNAGIVWSSISAALAPGAIYFRLFPVQLGFLFEALCLVPFVLLAVLPFCILIAGIKFARRSDVYSLLLPALAIWLSEMHRKEIYHLAYGAPLIIIAGMKFLEFVPRPRIRTLFLAGTAISLILVAFGDLWNTRGGYSIETRRGMVQDISRDEALIFLNTVVPRGELVFVYPYYPMYYYLAAVRNPTRYSLLMYHYNTTEQFDQVIRDLKDKHVKFVLWDTVVDGANLRTWFPGYLQPPPDQLKLEQYLQASYQLISIKNGFRILKLKE